ncbi:MAG: hypothetical protein P1U56_22550 [Saprospiraceae bacterium]|nr:hypothetical protein [Saprospiraceae bacterium]
MDIEKITKRIVKTATMSDLYYYKNKQEECYDIKFQSKRAGGEIDLDYDKFDVWEIRENLIFHNGLKHPPETSTFGFDEIHFDSTNEIINQEFFPYLMELKSNGKAVEKDGILIVKESGSYHTGIYYDIEFKDSKERIREADLSTFLKPRGEIANIAGIIDNENIAKDLDRFDYFAFCNPHDQDVFKLYGGFKSITFLWKNRPVNIAYKTETYWSGKNSDWWDNCLLPEWIDFRKKRKTHSNNT